MYTCVQDIYVGKKVSYNVTATDFCHVHWQKYKIIINTTVWGDKDIIDIKNYSDQTS